MASRTYHCESYWDLILCEPHGSVLLEQPDLFGPWAVSGVRLDDICFACSEHGIDQAFEAARRHAGAEESPAAREGTADSRKAA